MNKISVCTRYNTMGASSRLRFFMYKKLLEENGIFPQFLPLLGNGYLKRLYSGKKTQLHALHAMAKRFALLPFLKKLVTSATRGFCQVISCKVTRLPLM